MSESLHLDFNGQAFEATPDNTTLFTFMGRAAIRDEIEIDLSTFNHVFFQTGDEDDTTMTGSYMFRTAKNEGTFDVILSHIASEDFPMVLNRRSVPDCDVKAYYNMIDNVATSEQVGDFIPDEWQ
jgi:hypothetical protein